MKCDLETVSTPSEVPRGILHSAADAFPPLQQEGTSTTLRSDRGHVCSHMYAKAGELSIYWAVKIRLVAERGEVSHAYR